MDRASDYGSAGWWFNSTQAHFFTKLFQKTAVASGFFIFTRIFSAVRAGLPLGVLSFSSGEGVESSVSPIIINLLTMHSGVEMVMPSGIFWPLHTYATGGALVF